MIPYAKIAKYSDLLWGNILGEQISFLVSVLGPILEDPDITVLDAGCGTGRIIRSLSKMFPCHFQGFDASEEMLDIARQLSDDRIEYFTATLQNFNVNKKVDVILCLYSTFNYLTRDEDIVDTLNRFSSALKGVRGIVIIDTCNFLHNLVEGCGKEASKTFVDNELRVVDHIQYYIDTTKNIWTHDETLEIYENEKLVDTIRERHYLRYLTYAEFRLLLNLSDLRNFKCAVENGYDVSSNIQDRLIYIIRN